MRFSRGGRGHQRQLAAVLLRRLDGLDDARSRGHAGRRAAPGDPRLRLVHRGGVDLDRRARPRTRRRAAAPPLDCSSGWYSSRLQFQSRSCSANAALNASRCSSEVSAMVLIEPKRIVGMHVGTDARTSSLRIWARRDSVGNDPLAARPALAASINHRWESLCSASTWPSSTSPATSAASPKSAAPWIPPVTPGVIWSRRACSAASAPASRCSACSTRWRPSRPPRPSRRASTPRRWRGSTGARRSRRPTTSSSPTTR